jgi:hypothetical protein
MQGNTASELRRIPGLVVRPDQLAVAAAVFVEGQGPVRAVAIIRDAAELVLRAAGRIHPAAQLAARRLRVGGGASEKASKVERGDVSLEGVLRVPLGDDLDFWRRAALAAELTEAIAGVAVDLGKRKAGVQLAWREPVALVADEDALRTRLIERQRAFLRGLLEDKASAILPAILGAEVVQTPVSLDEVRVTLGATDAVRASASLE